MYLCIVYISTYITTKLCIIGKMNSCNILISTMYIECVMYNITITVI